MKNRIILSLVSISIFFTVAAIAAGAQTPQMLKRTTTKSDKLDFGSGGTVVVTTPPNGSVTIEGWSKNEIELTAEITVEAANNVDLERMARVTGFSLEESSGRLGVISAGTHDKKYLKTIDKKFPKALLANPFRIDYVLKVPRYCDLQIDGGKGDLIISGVEGMMKINYLDTNAKLALVGGGVLAVFGKGDVHISIPTRSWRGRNADFDASILRTGKIENGFTEFKPRVRKVEFTDQSIVAKSGMGGISLKFTVGDGTLKIIQDGNRN
jgi:hypothetical protein